MHSKLRNTTEHNGKPCSLLQYMLLVTQQHSDSHECLPADVAAQCAVVMSMLGTDAALESVFGAYIQAPSRPQGATYVDHSTVAPKLTAKLAEQAAAKGVDYVSSPVFGRPDAAGAKQLFVIAAGGKDAKAQVCIWRGIPCIAVGRDTQS